MSVPSDLPSNWRLDFPIKDSIPKTHNWSSFKRIPFAPRYAACICGGGVYDLERRVFLKPKIDKRNGRVRYRLVTSDLAAGKRGATRMPYYASIILTLTEGTRPNRKAQAHHQDHDRTNDTWRNLSWVTGKANRQMAAEHKSRAGSANPRANKVLRGETLAHFIAFYDHTMRKCGRVDLKRSAKTFDMSVDQLRRIATGKSRTAEVQAIRECLRREREQQARQEAQERRNRRTGYSREENPFFSEI